MTHYLYIAVMKTHHEEDNTAGHTPCRISLLLEVQSLDGFSLSKLCSFAKFTKLFPAKHSCYIRY